jgi:hypothetical protein
MMPRGGALALLVVALDARGAAADFDCNVRALMLDFARALQPGRAQADFTAMAASLAAASAFIPENNGTVCTLAAPRARARAPLLPVVRAAAPAFFVSPTGDDAAAGTLSAPFATLARGVAAARAAAPPGAPRAVELLAGTHFMNGSTLALDARDSGLTLSSSADAAVSGGTLLQGLVWARRGAPSGAWCAPLGAAPALPSVLGLRDARSGARYTRARFPNVDVEAESILDSGVVPWTGAWTPGPHPQPVKVLYPPYPLRDDIALFRHYTLGFGAPGSACGHLSPPYGFWCSNLTDREHNGTGFLSVPSSVSVNTTLLPHLPYANATGGVLHTWHAGRWFSAQFALDARLTTWDAVSGVSNFTFAAGGWQGSRGYGYGRDVSVENVREELDAPGEFFFDEATRELCVIPLAGGGGGGGGGGAPPDASLVALGPGSKVLVNVSGSQAAPVVNVSFAGLVFRDAAATYLDPHGLPSGGDWALARTAALFTEGTEGLRVEGCTFTSLDNNALFFSGYSRGATISTNTFSRLGESAVALWGRIGGAEADGAPGMGWDTRGGDQPRFTTIEGNLCSNIGIWQKQSACVFQAEAALTTISNNIFYDVPRAAINDNDLGMGGSVVERNAIWSVCKETADHGAWNSWSRTARVNDLHADGSPGGPPTTVPLWTHARGNLWIAQPFPTTRSGFAPGAQEAFDTDDGSAYLNVSGNVWVYGSSSLKSDLAGHDNRQSGNVILFVGAAFGVDAVLPGHADVFENNTVVLAADGAIGGGQDCSADAATRTRVAGNRYVSPTGVVKECGLPLAEWQARDRAANDPGSVAEAYPADLATAAVAWARALLGL